ncbi:MAG: type IV toxin-antitoxin system AbiEi family antitoxin [Bacteroidota bacterium]
MRSIVSWDIIKRFSGADQNCFTFKDVLLEYPDSNRIYLSRVLAGMIEKGMLIKLNRNLYHIVPSSADQNNYIPDWHLVAKYLMKVKQYYIGYYSAMQVHGLITQPSLKEIIVTNLQVKPSIKKIRGIEFQFVYHIKTRFFGYKTTWIDQHEKVMVSDLEKTIVDALTRPQLCGGMVEIGKALYESKEKTDLKKLIEYLNRNGNEASIKRYLFLVELLGLTWTNHHEEMLKKIGASYPVLDTTGPDQGKKDSRFGLKINIDTETIKKSIFT